MKHRLLALALASALAAAPLAMTATVASASPSVALGPTAEVFTPVATEIDSVEVGRTVVPQILADSKDRIVRAGQARTTRESGVSGHLSGLQDRASASTLSLAATTGRLSGANRYLTSVAISQDSHPTPTTDFGGILFVANGIDFPDALSAGPAATSLAGPILLVPSSGTVPSAVLDEMTRLAPQSVVIMGGTGAISTGVETQIRAAVPEPQGVFRAAGTDRYETSAIAALFVVKRVEVSPGVWDVAPVDTAIIATGLTFADALAGGAAGGWEYAPLLLTPPTALNGAVKQALAPVPPDPEQNYPGQRMTTVRILGGTAAVSNTVATEISSLLPGVTIRRHSGGDRFATAAALNAAVFPQPAFEVTLSQDLSFPDAVAAAPRVNKTGGPIILVRAQCVPSASAASLTLFNPTRVTAVGGTGVVWDAALNGTAC